MKKIYIQTEEGKRLIGRVENGIFSTQRKSSLHLYRKTNSWGIDERALAGMLADHGLHTVRVIDEETNTTYSTHVENFEKYGEHLHFRPHRLQIFLPLEYWTKTERFSIKKEI